MRNIECVTASGLRLLLERRPLSSSRGRERRDRPGRRWSVQDSLAFTSLFPFYERTVARVYRADLERLASVMVPDPAGFEFRVLKASDRGLMRQVEREAKTFLGPRELVVEEVGFCLAAVCEDRVAGFNLVAFKGVRLPPVHASRRLRSTEAWSELIFVRNDIRRVGLGSCLRYRSFEELRRRGIRRLYGCALGSDGCALEFASRTGFEEVAEIEYLRLFEGRMLRCYRVGKSVGTEASLSVEFDPSNPPPKEGNIAGPASR